jgi:Fe2+ transport system protein B
MKTSQKSKAKSEKPFLAARIPHSLENALESHVEFTGESKTQSIINALSAYLKWSENGEVSNASDRLSKVERKVAELEQLLKTPQQTNLLDLDRKSVISSVKQADNKKPTARIEQTSQEFKWLLTHREISDLTGINYNSVKSRPTGKAKIIEWNGRAFKVIQVEGRWKWREITSQHQED